MANNMHVNNVYNQQHAHQRQMMAVMGIDLWALRQQHVQSSSLSIFRDQLSVDAVSLEVSSQTQSPSSSSNIHAETDRSTNLALTSEHGAQDVQRNSTARQALAPPPQSTVTPADTRSDPAPVDTQNWVPEVVAVDVAAFELHACLFEHVAVLVDVQHLTADEAQLWANIRACQASQLRALNWPSPVLHFQDGQGVTAYIRGFVEALGSERKVICLGKCPQIGALNIVQLASLTEMLNRPQLKRELWQAIRSR